MRTVMRRARPEDIPRVVQMGLRFLGEIYPGQLVPNPDRMARTAAWLLEDDERALFVSEHAGQLTGMIGLFVYEHPMSGERTASEMFWWVEPEHRGHGVRLLKVARGWAKSAGATTIQMVAPGDDVERFYQRLGYTKVETAYLSVL